MNRQEVRELVLSYIQRQKVRGVWDGGFSINNVNELIQIQTTDDKRYVNGIKYQVGIIPIHNNGVKGFQMYDTFKVLDTYKTLKEAIEKGVDLWFDRKQREPIH